MNTFSQHKPCPDIRGLHCTVENGLYLWQGEPESGGDIASQLVCPVEAHSRYLFHSGPQYMKRCYD